MSSSDPPTLINNERQRFLSAVLKNPAIVTILGRMPQTELADWYLTAGGVIQTVWNVVTGRDPQAGIKDYDIFYFDDSDLSYEAEDAVIQRVSALFSDLTADVEVRNEARVHLWYEQKFGAPATPFTSCEDAIDHFASTTCCYGVRTGSFGAVHVYAPHGFRDLFALTVRPNPVLAPRAIYEAKTAQWVQEWPALTVVPWPDLADQSAL
jgi:uncharacterized protein